MSDLLNGRKFQFWEYLCNHGCALIRSPRDLEHITNVDIMFFGVVYLEVPRFLSSIRIDQANQSERERVENIVGTRLEGETIYVIVDQDKRHLVVAADMKIEENGHDLFYFHFRERIGWPQ